VSPSPRHLHLPLLTTVTKTTRKQLKTRGGGKRSWKIDLESVTKIKGRGKKS